jgi:hypothetical protein
MLNIKEKRGSFRRKRVHLGLLISLPFVEVRMQPKGLHHPAVPHHLASAQNGPNKCLNADVSTQRYQLLPIFGEEPCDKLMQCWSSCPAWVRRSSKDPQYSVSAIKHFCFVGADLSTNWIVCYEQIDDGCKDNLPMALVSSTWVKQILVTGTLYNKR